MSLASFPRDFYFGFSISSFQFEMGGPGTLDEGSDWWVWVRDPSIVASGLVSGDLPEDGPGYWRLYREDHSLAESLGLDSARLCVEWSRVFPRPTREVRVRVDREPDGSIVGVEVDSRALNEMDRLANKEAVERYREILSDWRRRGRLLILNLNHFTLPSWIHDPIQLRRRGIGGAPGGWLDKSTVVEFAKYAAYIAWKLGDLVDVWSTMNEPNALYTASYVNVKSGFPPGIPGLDLAVGAARNMAEAHARAYDAIKSIDGKPVGIIYVFTAFEPLDGGHEDAARAASEAFNYSFLDSITRGSSLLVGDRSDLKGRLDWLGVNYYTRAVVKGDGKGLGFKVVRGYGPECTPNALSLDGRPCSDIGWEVYPEGLYHVLRAVHERYGLDILVTENGVADSTDRIRPAFIASHIYQVGRALGEGVRVRGYLHWSLIDNYEWAHGFSMRFGLAHVDYSTKRRRLRPSALVYKTISTEKAVPDELEHLAKPPALDARLSI